MVDQPSMSMSLHLHGEHQRVANELHHKARLLEANVKESVETNLFLTKLSTELREIRSCVGPGASARLEVIIEMIRVHLLSADIYSMATSELDSYHSDFMQRLQMLYPSLSTSELRVAAMLRMKLTSATIARILFLSRRTVEHHRQHIRKKLRLHCTDNLYLRLIEI